jgi:hypothetical protein
VQEQKAEKQGPKRNGAAKPLTAAEKEAQSEAFKSQGNGAFKKGNFADAVALYTAALELTPNSNVRSSRYPVNEAEFCLRLRACHEDCRDVVMQPLRFGCVVLVTANDHHIALLS